MDRNWAKHLYRGKIKMDHENISLQQHHQRHKIAYGSYDDAQEPKAVLQQAFGTCKECVWPFHLPMPR